ncbi:putative zinc-binding metallopeptidase [uncultured Pseudacidovorax sp.]|uniref:zinc-binding metallopeptidase family protein n=1 Tax=uncultured Pseudacidovorax sp. TaxID=679313 RepID=UPI0025E70415|nr:putative zinc-binding metallopeptidase [uncultured Pseudacidovorax sp.]
MLTSNDSSAPVHSGGSLADELAAPAVSRAYVCQCGRPVYLRNSQCLACSTPLGYVTSRVGVLPLAPTDDPDLFTVFGEPDGPRYRRCTNFTTAASCNWLVPEDAEAEPGLAHTHGLAPGLCLACSATRTIPDLSVPENPELWQKMETAKRRVLSQLLALGLPISTRLADPDHGLAFDFLSNLPGAPRVLTGHQDGVITLNIEEGDDAQREKTRAEMREPYRTLVGHFRHEIGHYYWDVLVAPTPWLQDFRALFGDETQDYGQALQRHYENGPPADWALRYVTSYASTHPWEDWAETWAHYLHMADTVDTALSFGVNAVNVELTSDLFTREDLWQPDHEDADRFLDFLNGWVRLTNVLNELSRSMGQPDFYPFVLPHAAVGKLQYIHQLVTAQRGQPAPVRAEGAEPAPVQEPPPIGDPAPVQDPQPEPAVSQQDQAPVPADGAVPVATGDQPAPANEPPQQAQPLAA